MISIIIPTFNRENLIQKAVKSVLEQTYQDIEVIVVDDGSTDHTAEKVEEIQDKRVRYLKLEKNGGACRARNKGAEIARGKYLAFQDSDDIWHKNKLEKQIQFLENGGYDFVFCGMTRIMLGDESKRYYYPNEPLDPEKSIFYQFLYLNRVGTQTILCKTECFEKIRFDESLRRFQDWDLALQAAKNYRVGYLKESLVDSFIQMDSISQSKKANSQAWRMIYKKYQKEIDSKTIIKAKYYFRMGNEVLLQDASKAADYYVESLKENKNIKTMMMYILCKLKLTQISSWLLDYQKRRLFK